MVLIAIYALLSAIAAFLLLAVVAAVCKEFRLAGRSLLVVAGLLVTGALMTAAVNIAS